MALDNTFRTSVHGENTIVFTVEDSSFNPIESENGAKLTVKMRNPHSKAVKAEDDRQGRAVQLKMKQKGSSYIGQSQDEREEDGNNRLTAAFVEFVPTTLDDGTTVDFQLDGITLKTAKDFKALISDFPEWKEKIAEKFMTLDNFVKKTLLAA
jgi:hypothetical protein